MGGNITSEAILHLAFERAYNLSIINRILEYSVHYVIGNCRLRMYCVFQTSFQNEEKKKEDEECKSF